MGTDADGRRTARPRSSDSECKGIGFPRGSEAEDGDIVGFLKRTFALEEESVRELLKAADELRTQTIDHFALTNFIRKNAPLSDRIEIVKTMWRMVYSDRKLTDYEAYLVRKLADLLGIEHHVMIEAKVGVLQELGLST